MTRPNIEELDWLWEEATAGEWTADVTPNGPCGQICRSECVRDSDGVLIAQRPNYDDVPRMWPRNARAIAALHNAYPELSAYVKALEKERDEWKELCGVERLARESADRRWRKAEGYDD